MAEKKKSIIVVLPRAVAAHAYLDKPDTQVPEGASFKADNKFKVTSIYDDAAALAKADAIIREAAKAKWSDVDFEEFKFPWTTHDEDARKEAFRGKTTVTTKSQHKPKLVDSKKNAVPESVKVRGGDIIATASTVYLYEKTEKVKEGKKLIDVVTRGASLQLFSVQLIEKRNAAGSGGDVFDEEDGFEVSESDTANAAAGSADDF